MKELTREELPTDGTHFVVTWVFEDVNYSDTCKFDGEDTCSLDTRTGAYLPVVSFGSPDIRFWQFPEGETK